MNLTNKCSDAFDKYIVDNCHMVYHGCPDFVVHAIAVAFFDSVGIHINCFSVSLIYTSYGWGIDLEDKVKIDYDEYQTESTENEYESRDEAYADAIVKANTIFNQAFETNPSKN